MREIYIMKCGHAHNCHQVLNDGTEVPACVICGCTEVDHIATSPSEGLEGRKAKCAECSCVVDSRWDLAFFAHRPDRTQDEFYCGCHGWD